MTAPKDPAQITRVFELIDSFVEKSGGVEQVRMAVRALRKLSEFGDPQALSDYVVNVGKKPEGARQLIAASLLGFSMAAVLYKKKESFLEKKKDETQS